MLPPTTSELAEAPKHVATAWALLGFVRFLKGWFLVLASEVKRVGYVDSHVVFAVAKTRLMDVCVSQQQPPSSMSRDDVGRGGAGSGADGTTKMTGAPSSWRAWLGARAYHPIDDAEERYKSLFQLVDLTRDFYFSQTLDLSRTLQDHLAPPLDSAQRGRLERDTKFKWNNFLLSELLEVIAQDSPSSVPWWNATLIHGWFGQKRFSTFGRAVTLTLIGRRSRCFAGTRYLKRGVDDAGNVANEVEVEQIVEADPGSISAFVQVRGSIPTFWTQETSATVPKPPIRRFRYDAGFHAARAHFRGLFERYGDRVHVLNLVRQYERRPRESLVGDEFKECVEMLNIGLAPECAVGYTALDFKRASKRDSGVLAALREVAEEFCERIGFFALSAGSAAQVRSFQHGVVRTNCIDNLDRTNVGQYVVGACALERQLAALRVELPGPSNNNPRLMAGGAVFWELFERLGDAVAQQYGGSQAHKKGDGESPIDSLVATQRELLTSVRRYYSNSFTDRAKQDAINLFLGSFRPSTCCDAEGAATPGSSSKPNATPPSPPSREHLWDLENDLYLHLLRVSSPDFSLKVDPGTATWWIPRGPIARVVPAARRPPLFSQGGAAPDAWVSFDDVFADEFFRPVTMASSATLPHLVMKIAEDDERDSVDGGDQPASGGGLSGNGGGIGHSPPGEGPTQAHLPGGPHDVGAAAARLSRTSSGEAAAATAVGVDKFETTEQMLRGVRRHRRASDEVIDYDDDEDGVNPSFREFLDLWHDPGLAFDETRFPLDPALRDQRSPQDLVPDSIAVSREFAARRLVELGPEFRALDRGLVLSDLYDVDSLAFAHSAAMYSSNLALAPGEDARARARLARERAVFESVVRSIAQ